MGLKLDPICKDMGKRSMYGESEVYLSMDAAVTGVELAASLTKS